MRSLASLALVLLASWPAWADECATLPIGTPCHSDGNSCTNDICGAPGVCGHLALPNGTACTDDGNVCTLDYCSFSVCSHSSGPNGVACATDSNDCTSDTCTSGVCAHWPVCTSDCPCSAGPVRLITSCADTEPNTAAVIPTDARVYQQADASPAHRWTTNAETYVWWYEHANAAQTATVLWYAYDATASVWVLISTDTAVPVRARRTPSTAFGPLTLYPRVTACSELVGAGITVYATAR